MLAVLRRSSSRFVSHHASCSVPAAYNTLQSLDVRCLHTSCQSNAPDDEGKIIIGATASEVEELIDRNLDNKYRSKEDVSPLQVLTTRREALSLYRDILRWSLLFVWKNDRGQSWKDVIRESARKEYEEARFETDPEIINRLLVSGRDCVQQVKDRFVSQRQRIINEEAAAQERGVKPPDWRPPDASAFP